MGEIVEQAVNEGSQKAITDNQLKPAFTPRIEPVGDVQQVVDGKADLQFTVTVDLMPDFETADVSKLKVERLTADVTDAEVDEALERLAEQTPQLYAARPKAKRPQKDDIGRRSISSAASTAWSSKAARARISISTLGSGQFIPGFEDQLIGAKAGETRDVKVTFPADYHAAELAGKDAVFAVTVKEVKAPEAVADRRRAGPEDGPRPTSAPSRIACATRSRPISPAPAACI